MHSDKFKKRCIREAKLMISQNFTIREVAKIVGLSKSTIHKDLTERLKEYKNKECRELYQNVIFIMKINKEQRHIRGGVATKKKYLAMKKNK